MSRLYYPKAANTATLVGGQPPNAAKDYLEKVAKLIPSEVLAVYLGLIGWVPAVRFAVSKTWLYAGVFLVCLVLTPLYLSAMADKNKPKRIHLIVSTIAFPIWAYSVSGGSVIPRAYDPAVAGMLTLIFTAISGLIPLD
jgi:hypothetical protein